MPETPSVTTPEPAVPRAEVPAGFGRKIAGSFLLRFDLPGGNVGRGLVAMHEDGSMTHGDQSDFGLGNPQKYGYASPGYGSWRKTGAQSIEGTSLNMAFDDKGTPRHFTRWTTKVTYDSAFDAVSGESLAENYPLDQDPLNPQVEPISSLSSTFTGKRIRP